MNGTLAGPAPMAAGGAIRLPRLWAPLVVALAMHAAILALRPGGLTGSHVAPAASAMAVRVLHAPPAAEPTRSDERAPAPIPTVEPVPAAAPRESASHTTARHERSQPPAARAVAHAAPASPTVAQHDVPAQSAAPEMTAAMPGAASTALPAAPDYALGIRLDPGPRPLDDIDPDYPDPYLREGTVVLRLLISETGHVDNVAVVRAQPIGVFEQAALDAFGKARFAPGLAAGMPVKSQITVEVRFVPVNRGARVSGRTY